MKHRQISPYQIDTEKIQKTLEQDPRIVSPHTVRAYLSDLKKFEEWREGRPLTKTLVEQYISEMQEQGKSAATINRSLAALRWWARRHREKALDIPAYQLDRQQQEKRDHFIEQTQRINETQGIPQTDDLPGRRVYLEEIDDLISACLDDPDPAGTRDAAMIAFAWQTGARRAEIAGLQLQDIENNGNGADITLKHGTKGKKNRKVYLNNGAYLALLDWLQLRGREPGPVFNPNPPRRTHQTAPPIDRRIHAPNIGKTTQTSRTHPPDMA